jgi:hypothetical protein
LSHNCREITIEAAPNRRAPRWDGFRSDAWGDSQMFSKLLAGWCLMGICVGIHALGITWALRLLRRGPRSRRFWRWTLLFIRVAGWIIFLHLIEISVWALFFDWRRAMPDLQSAFYFSAVTYTTTGYGDLVLPEEWRLVGAVEALTGILMCGWSTGFFFAIANRMFEAQPDSADSTAPPER